MSHLFGPLKRVDEDSDLEVVEAEGFTDYNVVFVALRIHSISNRPGRYIGTRAVLDDEKRAEDRNAALGSHRLETCFRFMTQDAQAGQRKEAEKLMTRMRMIQKVFTRKRDTLQLECCNLTIRSNRHTNKSKRARLAAIASCSSPLPTGYPVR